MKAHTITADRIIIRRQGARIVHAEKTDQGARHPGASNRSGCKVSVIVDEEGNIGEPFCENINCSEECDLKSDMSGNSEHYWCSCG